MSSKLSIFNVLLITSGLLIHVSDAMQQASGKRDILFNCFLSTDTVGDHVETEFHFTDVLMHGVGKGGAIK